MITLSEEQANVEWVKLYGIFESCGLLDYFDMDELKEQIINSPCGINEDSGTAYKGGLLTHINMTCAIAQRIAKMISGTFKIDENSMLKVCVLMHLSKIEMFVENDNEWEVKNRGLVFKFNKEIEGCLKSSDRSILYATNKGVKFTPTEIEAMKCLDEDVDNGKKAFSSIMTTVIRQANELSYALEKERYNKTVKEINN